MPETDAATPVALPAGRPLHVHVVCTGNICRSPMGEIILSQLVDEAGLAQRVTVTSSGTGDWHVGEQADARTIATLECHGYDGSRHRAATFAPDDVAGYDVILAADDGHVQALRRLVDPLHHQRIRLIRSFDPGLLDADDADRQTADPWYGDEADFETCFAHVEAACRGFVAELQRSAEAEAGADTDTQADHREAPPRP